MQALKCILNSAVKNMQTHKASKHIPNGQEKLGKAAETVETGTCKLRVPVSCAFGVQFAVAGWSGPSQGVILKRVGGAYHGQEARKLPDATGN